MKKRDEKSGVRESADGGIYEEKVEPFYGGYTDYGAPLYYGGAHGGADSGGAALMSLLRIIARRWKILPLTAILGCLVGGLKTLLTVPVYRAEAELEMSVQRPRIIKSDAVFEDQVRDTDIIINTRFAKFRSPAMEKLAVANYFRKYPKADVSEQELAAQVRRVYWSKDRRANIVRVSLQSEDPVFAAQLVNVLCDCAGELMVQENQTSSEGAVKWLTLQVEEKRHALEKVEEELSKIRQTVQLEALKQSKEAQGNSLVVLLQEKTALESQLAGRKVVAEFMRGLLESEQNIETFPAGLPKEDELRSMVAVWRNAEDHLKDVATRYTPIHPAYIEAKMAVVRARERLDAHSGVCLKAVQSEISLLEKKFTGLEKRVDDLKSDTITLEQKLTSGEQWLRRMERTYEAADNAYRAVLKRMEEVRFSVDETTAFTKIIRSAPVPGNPINPHRNKTLLTFTFLGLLVGIGLAFLMEFWADEVSQVGELEALGLNILGTIPCQKNVESRGDLAVLGLNDRFSHIFEVFAGINAMISSEKYRDRTQVILVCSVMPAEGKTTSACNLAISAAMNGSRTLLIDGDLRRPRLATLFGVDDSHPSLLEWLADEKHVLDLKELVHRGAQKDLDVIISRTRNDVNPAEFMGRGALGELFHWAREHYDRIIIDSPPMGVVGDSQVLANQADSVILVSQIGKTSRRALRFVLRRFVELDTNVLGCIANKVPPAGLLDQLGGSLGSR